MPWSSMLCMTLPILTDVCHIMIGAALWLVMFGCEKLYADSGNCMVTVQEDLMVPSLFICSECKEIEEDRSNVATCAECGVGSEFHITDSHFSPTSRWFTLFRLPNSDSWLSWPVYYAGDISFFLSFFRCLISEVGRSSQNFAVCLMVAQLYKCRSGIWEVPRPKNLAAQKHDNCYSKSPLRRPANVVCSCLSRCGAVHCYLELDLWPQYISQSVSAARNRLWVVAPSMLTCRRRQPMRQQQWVRCPARSDSSKKSVVCQPDDSSRHVVPLRIWNSWRASGPCVLAYCQADVVCGQRWSDGERL